jgi:hypothetical protein
VTHWKLSEGLGGSRETDGSVTEPTDSPFSLYPLWVRFPSSSSFLELSSNLTRAIVDGSEGIVVGL